MNDIITFICPTQLITFICPVLNPTTVVNSDCSRGKMEVKGKGEREVLLMSKKVEIQTKLFNFDLKENSAGQFLHIANQIGSRTRFAIVLPSHSISTFLDAFNSCLDSPIKHQELHIGTKVISIDVGENRWGSFLKITESSIDKYKGSSSILIPSGRNQKEGWETFGKILTKMYTTSKHIFPPKEQKSDSSEQLVGVLPEPPDVSESSTASPSQLKSPAQNRASSYEISRMMRAGPSRFYFDLHGKRTGPFLKISEVIGLDRSSIFIPMSEVKQFYEIVGDFLKTFNDSSEGGAPSVAVVNQSSSEQPPTEKECPTSSGNKHFVFRRK